MSEGLDQEILAALQAPFDPSEEKQREGRGRVVFTYIDARAVMDRLDEVVGPANWAHTFKKVADEGYAVECALTVFGVTKADCGQADAEDEPWKAAYSDAFKRAAVHFGVGRYLYAKKPTAQRAQPMPQGQAIPPNTARSPLADEAANLGLQREASAAPPARSAPVGTARKASEAQVKFIYKLIQDQDLDVQEAEQHCVDRYGAVPNEIGIQQASEFIEWLKLAPV